MSNKDDVNHVSQDPNCPHRKYEEKRVVNLLRDLTLSQEAMTDMPENFEMVPNTNILDLIQHCEDLVKQIQSSCEASVIWAAVEIVTNVCKQNLQDLASLLPVFKSRVHEFTDAGPGVGVTNHDVQIRCAEIILLTEPDYYIMHHLANDDSSQNEVERCQNYAGDAICDGGSIPWEHNTPYEGISDEELSSMHDTGKIGRK
jgi:hypothetical protein